MFKWSVVDMGRFFMTKSNPSSKEGQKLSILSVQFVWDLTHKVIFSSILNNQVEGTKAYLGRGYQQLWITWWCAPSPHWDLTRHLRNVRHHHQQMKLFTLYYSFRKFRTSTLICNSTTQVAAETNILSSDRSCFVV